MVAGAAEVLGAGAAEVAGAGAAEVGAAVLGAVLEVGDEPPELHPTNIKDRTNRIANGVIIFFICHLSFIIQDHKFEPNYYHMIARPPTYINCSDMCSNNKRYV